MSAIFMAISAGTFIYISTVEVIVEEFNFSRYKWKKFFFYVVGFVLVAYVKILEDSLKSEKHQSTYNQVWNIQNESNY